MMVVRAFVRAVWSALRAGRPAVGGGTIAPWPPEEDPDELLAFQVAHGVYRCPPGCTEHVGERARADRVPAILSPGGVLLECGETVVGRHDMFTGPTARCPRHGWREVAGIEWDEDAERDEHGRPTRWSAVILNCGATVVPADQG